MEKTNTGKKRELEGVIIGNSMNNTIKVRVDTTQSHPVYKKVISRTKIYFAHVTDGEHNIGDRVVIRESKPFSKKVRWIVINK